jgi:hypothetical protein
LLTILENAMLLERVVAPLGTNFMSPLYLLQVRKPSDVSGMIEGAEHQPGKGSDQGRRVGQKDQPGGPGSAEVEERPSTSRTAEPQHFHQGQRAGNPVQWQDAGDLQHIYAVNEFERQVYARLQPIDGVRRVSEYSIPAIQVGEVEPQLSKFNTSFPRPKDFAWNSHGRSQSKDQNKAPQKPSDMTIECDLYVKLPPGTSMKDLFKDCADEVVNLSRPDSAGSSISWADLDPT